MKNTVILFCGLAFGISCQQPIQKEADTYYTIKGDTIIILENSPLAEKIKTTEIAFEPYRSEIITAGIVKVIPTQFAQITSPFSGRVVNSYMKLGQKVSPNSPLFEISSAEFIASQKNFFQAKSDYQLTLQTLNRQKDLIENGVGTKRNLEEAQNNLELALQEYRNTSEAIKIFSVNPEEMRLGQTLIIRSPIEGNIIENNLVVGQFLKEDTNPIATVAELSKVWVVGQVKEKDIHHFHNNDEVEIKISAYPDLQLKGKIFHIQEVINEETRSVEIIIESDNPELSLKHGMYVTTRFQNQPVDKIMLPEKSVLQQEDYAYVYVQDSKNRYVKRKIKTNDTINGKIVIESDISPSEIIVIEGGYYLLNAH